MTRKTKAQLQSEITANLADNTTRDISAEDVRDVVTNITDSMIFPSSDETDVTITSDTSAKPVLTIQNTNDDATGATIKFNKNTGDSAAAADVLGNIDFAGEDADENAHTYARILAKTDDPTADGEEGSIEFYVAEFDGTLTKGMDIVGLGSDTNITVDISTHDGSAGGLKLGGTLVTASATELNYVDGVSSAIQTQMDAKQASLTFGIANTNVIKCGTGIVNDDFIRIDGTTLEGRSASQVLTDIAASPVAGSSSIVTVGALAAGSIASGFGNITTTGTIDISGGTLTVAADGISGDKIHGGTISGNVVLDDGATATTQSAGNNTTKIATTAYADAAGGGGGGTITALNNATENELVTVGNTTTELDAESALTFDGTKLLISETATTGTAPLEVLRLEVTESSGVELAVGEGPAMTFYVGNDGASAVGAQIAAVREQAADDDNASSLKFYTAADGAAATEKLVISSAGVISTTGTIDISGGTLTLAADQISGDKVEGGTIAATTITALTTAGITATANIDIGAYDLRAKTLVSDIADGTAPLTVTSTTVVSNLNADKLDGQHGSYYLDFGNFVIDDDEIPIAKLASDAVSYGGVSVTLGASDATPAFDLTDATNVPLDQIKSGTTLSVASGGTGASSAPSARTNLGVDAAGEDNSTNVTLVTSSHDYLSISTQAITLGAIDLATDVTGTLPVGSVSTITLGTNTAGNYVATVTGGTGITSTGATSGESIAHSLSVDASQTQITAVGTLVGLTLDGDKDITPGDGSMIHLDTSTLTDNNTSGSGTAAKFASVAFEASTLAATNASVTTTDAATVYISAAPSAGTNQTLTRAWALWIDAGNLRYDGSIYAGTTEALSSGGLVTVANQSNITGVGTISSGTWEGATVAVDQGGTGQTTYTNGQLLIGNTTGNTLTKATLTAGSNISITNGTGTISIAATNNTYTAGDGLNESGGTFSTDLKANGGLVIESTELAVDLSASSITGTLPVGSVGTITLGTNTAGNYVASLIAGTLIDLQNNTGESATPTIDVNLSELYTSTSDGDGDFFVVVDSSDAQKKLTKANIALSGFNNDSLFTTNTGTVDVSGTPTAGHVAIWSDADTITFDSAQLFWDTSSNELGIGTSSPGSTLDVRGSVSFKTFTVTGDAGEGDANWSSNKHDLTSGSNASNYHILCETGATDRIILLPDATSTIIGRTYVIKKIDSGVGIVTIWPDDDAGETGYLDGDNVTVDDGTNILFAQYDTISCTCGEGTTSDTFTWHVVHEKVKPHYITVRQDSAQTIANAFEVVTLDSTLGTSNGITFTDANDKVTIARAGRYIISFKVSIASVNGQAAYIGVLLNLDDAEETPVDPLTMIAGSFVTQHSNGAYLYISSTTTVDLAVDDTLKVVAWSDAARLTYVGDVRQKSQISVTEVR